MTPAKRLFDLVIALALGLILLVPLALLMALMWLTEGRPVFYVSERMRAPGQPFALIKLRTMRPAPADSGVTGGDKSARMSRLHRILRRTRADEIPQLWNVIRGDMSLVGPRPPLRLYVEAFPDLYAQVLRNRPGITGLAQVKGLRGETSDIRLMEERIRYDIEYANNWSLFLDIKILVMTVLVVLFQKSAY